MTNPTSSRRGHPQNLRVPIPETQKVCLATAADHLRVGMGTLVSVSLWSSFGWSPDPSAPPVDDETARTVAVILGRIGSRHLYPVLHTAGTCPLRAERSDSRRSLRRVTGGE